MIGDMAENMNDCKRIKYPVGIQTFPEIIEEGYLYVDKTELIYDLVTTNKFVFLSRPRRFGKSLLLSTIEAYFEGRKNLFEGLAVSDLERAWKKHPVLRADLSPESYESPEKLEKRLNLIIGEWGSRFGTDPLEDTIAAKFRGVIRRAVKQTGEKVVILIDEYDKPLLESLHKDELHSTLRDELKGFYSVLKESDQYIRFAMLTGVTKFGHVSVFSGLNNLKDISLLPKYNALCGIAESEFRRDFKDSVSNFALENEMREQDVWQIFRENYDGYHFCDGGEGIYNPFSVLLAFDDARLGEYWFSSGTPTILVKIIERNNYSVAEVLKQRLTESELKDLTNPDRNLTTLLYQSGYLTVKSYDKATRKYSLDFPNREVASGFWDFLYKNYVLPANRSTAFDIENFVDELKRGEAGSFMERLKSLFASLSTGNAPKLEREIHFQNTMTVIFRLLGLQVNVEVPVASGRTDTVVETEDYVYIFEYKINLSAEAALRQIHDKGYAAPFAKESRKVYLIGINFDTAVGTLSACEIEPLN